MRLFYFVLAGCLPFSSAVAQSQPAERDSLHHHIRQLSDVKVIGMKSNMLTMPDIQGTSIYAGKKNNIILIDKTPANLSVNSMRQVLAKVPGIHVWESDPGGAQVAIAARGLSPNRSWDFNIRQNGYDIAADPYGYPEAYYSPPLQGVEKIEIVRGQAALQYGPQFGGMVNYVLKNGSNTTAPFQFETDQTIGSNGLWNAYQSISGKAKKMYYHTFFNHRSGNGWRQNSRFSSNTLFTTATFLLNTNLSVTAELLHFQSLVQQPGGLTDSMFLLDPQQSIRSRNWMQIKWMTPAITIQHNINSNTKWSTKIFALIAERNSVGFMQSVQVYDTINSQTQQYNERILLGDSYRNIGFESRIASTYQLLGKKHTFTSGIRFFKGHTLRNGNGKGSTLNEFDMRANGSYPQAIDFFSKNSAVYVENLFTVGRKLMVIPGARLEHISGSAEGRAGYASNGNPLEIPFVLKARKFIIAGLGVQYNINSAIQLYSNITQAYRPIQFSNLQVPPATDSIDKNISDAKGYNADLGLRGTVKNILRFDMSIFVLNYQNRIGTITGSNGARLTTNVGDSKSYGLEAYTAFHPSYVNNSNPKTDVSLFCAYSYTRARYSNTQKTESTRGKLIENAPPNIVRGGLSIEHSSFNLTIQYSFTDATFSDANNTSNPSANALNGIIPSYQIWDCNIGWKIKKYLTFAAGVNNIGNEFYFTRRASGYPGPGVMPADGRTLFCSLKLEL
jgi:Fe(3+) dicitrate transport protein